MTGGSDGLESSSPLTATRPASSSGASSSTRRSTTDGVSTSKAGGADSPPGRDVEVRFRTRSSPRAAAVDEAEPSAGASEPHRQDGVGSHRGSRPMKASIRVCASAAADTSTFGPY